MQRYVDHRYSLSVFAPFFLALPIGPECRRSPLKGLPKLDPQTLFSYLRILRDKADNRNSVLKLLCVSYGAGMTGHSPTPRRIAGIESPTTIFCQTSCNG